MSDESALTRIRIGEHSFTSKAIPYNSDLVSLFTEDELQYNYENYFNIGYHQYSIGVDEVCDRLQLRGFTARRAREALDAWVLEYNSTIIPEHYLIDDPYWHVEEKLDSLLGYLNSPLDPGQPYRPRPDEILDISSLGILMSLRLVLELVEDRSKRVRYVFDDLLVRQLGITRSRTLSDYAREERRKDLTYDAPLVVLTEGSSDSQLLTAAVSVTHPHLARFLRFMDFSTDAEGSAASLAKLVRSFIGAGIANRVVAVADNDTAAHDVLDRLRYKGLPEGYRILYYPNLPLLEHYPTLGPQSANPVPMDVNGKAGSLEMYLGRELLTVANQLVPVQWTGYVNSQRSYQGAIAPQHKARIQKGFLKKVTLALQSPDERSNQDWEGVTKIINSILRAFD